MSSPYPPGPWKKFCLLHQCTECYVKWHEFVEMKPYVDIDLQKVYHVICDPCRGQGPIPKNLLGHKRTLKRNQRNWRKR